MSKDLPANLFDASFVRGTIAAEYTIRQLVMKASANSAMPNSTKVALLAAADLVKNLTPDDVPRDILLGK